ncbi:MAG: AMP-binding protein [Oscillospiraceae bacterium]|nr:AMP-binding protein [Oscillospiraceae bacterium]MCL2279462.1 AMP-binding protein [Oscillospiraceae bacterium]
MFLGIENINPSKVAAIDENGLQLTYGELCDAAREISAAAKERTLVFALCENTIGSLVGYVSFISSGVVPLLLDSNMPEEHIDCLVNTYNPSYIWTHESRDFSKFRKVFSGWGHNLYATDLKPFSLHDELALLVTTSGSTGSPKLVRQSFKNIESNTKSICEYLEIDSTERPVTTLPMQYVYGTSIINSHLKKGATILLTTKGIMQKEFWEFFKEQKATSIAGVPYTYEILKKLRFTNMKLPSLKTMTQAGGKLLPELHKEFAQYASENDVNFVIMYGAAEATARMGYLPPKMSLEKYGSMGIAIPGGRFELIDESGDVIREYGMRGELVYYGENVTLGYAENGEDLKKGDERSGRLETGDMATLDSDGYYTIVGRKKRFLKIFGNRVGLDETERLIKSRFSGIECACCGVDDKMYIFITDASLKSDILGHISDATSLNVQAFCIKVIDEIPKNDSGKTQYSKLEEYYD